MTNDLTKHGFSGRASSKTNKDNKKKTKITSAPGNEKDIASSGRVVEEDKQVIIVTSLKKKTLARLVTYLTPRELNSRVQFAVVQKSSKTSCPSKYVVHLFFNDRRDLDAFVESLRLYERRVQDKVLDSILV